MIHRFTNSQLTPIIHDAENKYFDVDVKFQLEFEFTHLSEILCWLTHTPAGWRYFFKVFFYHYYYLIIIVFLKKLIIIFILWCCRLFMQDRLHTVSQPPFSLPLYLYIYLFIYLSFIYTSIQLSVFLSMYLSGVSFFHPPWAATLQSVKMMTRARLLFR